MKRPGDRSLARSRCLLVVVTLAWSCLFCGSERIASCGEPSPTRLLTVAGGPALEEGVLAGAETRIDLHRKGIIVVRVEGADGQAVEGVRVRMRQKRHEFLFGCNIFLHGRAGDPALDGLYQEKFAALFNFATLPFYWEGYERERGKPAHVDRERVARWCREQNIVTKGHPLVWNHPASVPRWLPSSAREARELSDARVKDCVIRFRGAIDIWDVVNEATDPWRFRAGNRMTRAWEELGVLDWTVRSFQVARRANPTARLLINDYRTDPAYEKLIESLVVDGKPLYDVIGIQSHMHGGAWKTRRVWDVCERFSRFGVPLHFTETTIVSGPRLDDGRWGTSEAELEEVQAREAVRFYTTLFSHPAVEAITWWDFADLRAWQGAAAGFLRADLSPKPAYERLHELIRGAWWSDLKTVTKADGTATERAFFGDYEIEVVDGERRASAEIVHRRRDGRSEVRLSLVD